MLWIPFLSLFSLSLSRSLNRKRQWHPTPVLLPGKSHGWRSLVGCSPWGRLESDTTEQLHFDISLSCIGEGKGNQLQCSCQENPRDGGAWWAAVYGVSQSRTRLKRLSSSSRSLNILSEERTSLFFPSEFLISNSSWKPQSSFTDYLHVNVRLNLHCLLLLWEYGLGSSVIS